MANKNDEWEVKRVNLTSPSGKNFAVLRTAKLKTFNAIKRSLDHSFREQETQNADPDKLKDNESFFASNTKEAMANLKDQLPEKYRKDAVLCIEYLIASSHDVMIDKSKEEQDQYFKDSLEWLQEKHGRENVVCAGIHRDETTPHMYVYVVPKVNGKLNCKHFLGGRDKLSDMQTEFAEKIGVKHGLDRGIKGSKAKHVEIKKYYENLKRTESIELPIEVPEPTLKDRVNVYEYGYKVAKEISDNVNDLLTNRLAHAKKATEIAQNLKEMTETADYLSKRLSFIDEFKKDLKLEDKKLFDERAKPFFEKLAIDMKKEAEERERLKKENSIFHQASLKIQRKKNVRDLER